MGQDDPEQMDAKPARIPRKASGTSRTGGSGKATAGEVALTEPSVIRAEARSPARDATVVEDGAPIAADRVALYRSAVGRVEAGELRVEQGAVGAARADTLSVDRGAVGAVMAGNVEVSRGYARSILARQVQLDRGAARIVIAADVRAQQSAVMFLVARRVSGEMRVLFDWRGALAFGAAAGAVFALLSRLRRRTA